MCMVPAVMGARRGYVVSPGYPRRYPATERNCSVTVVVPSTAVVRLQVLDMFIASSYSASNRRLCRDRFAYLASIYLLSFTLQIFLLTTFPLVCMFHLLLFVHLLSCLYFACSLIVMVCDMSNFIKRI